MLKNKKSKIALFLALTLFLTGTGVVAHQIFFREIEIKIEQIAWVDEFKIEIPEITLKEPCILVIESKKSEDSENSEIVDGRLIIQKQNIEIGACTNSRILVPLRIENIAEKNNRPFFFVPQFRAKITGGEEEQLEADFSLYLLSNNCPKENIIINNVNVGNKKFSLCDLNISSINVRSFSITELRKNTLAEAIKNLANRDDYILVLKIAPDLEVVRDISSFSISIENITPELIIVD